MMAWERDRRLKEKLNYLHELEKVKNFDWDDWRKRFLKHHNNKKSRVTDLFRKLDEDGDGYLTRDDFVEGILKNKFLSSRLEMNAVADKFDHGDGMIDWREFIAALRPDWTDRGPLTDMERIDDEINHRWRFVLADKSSKCSKLVKENTDLANLKSCAWSVFSDQQSWSVLEAVGWLWMNFWLRMIHAEPRAVPMWSSENNSHWLLVYHKV